MPLISGFLILNINCFLNATVLLSLSNLTLSACYKIHSVVIAYNYSGSFRDVCVKHTVTPKRFVTGEARESGRSSAVF